MQQREGWTDTMPTSRTLQQLNGPHVQAEKRNREERTACPRAHLTVGHSHDSCQEEAKQSVSRTTPVVSRGVLLIFLIKVAGAVLVGIQGDSD